MFVVSGVAAVWTHFYGINLLVADQIVWMLLLWRNVSLRKLWMTTTSLCLLFAAPIVPILLFYLDVEKQHSLLRIANFTRYFLLESNFSFGNITFNVPLVLPVILVWYLITAALLWKWCREDATVVQGSLLGQSSIVLIGVFLSGFPAMQMHSLISGEAMWERYTLHASWVHWPLVVLSVWHFVNRRIAIVVSDGAFAFAWIALVGMVGLRQYWTFDHQPVVRFLETHAQPGDAFLAQDIDIFAGDSSAYRLWFQRYSPVSMDIVTGPPRTRFELQDNGIPVEQIDESVTRLWIYSHMYLWTEEKLRGSTQWRPIAKLTAHPRPPLVLLERNPQSVSDSMAH